MLGNDGLVLGGAHDGDQLKLPDAAAIYMRIRVCAPTTLLDAAAMHAYILRVLLAPRRRKPNSLEWPR